MSVLRCCKNLVRSHIQCQLRQPSLYRSMAIYAVGEGWTGAMTQSYVLETVRGHFDEDTADPPVLIYPHDDIQQAAVGWGCTAFLDTQGQVHLVGRPQDLMTLLRMNRMPKWIQNLIHAHSDPSDTTIVGTMISKLIGLATGGDESQDWELAREYSLLHDWKKVDLKAARLGDTTMSQITCSSGFMAMIGSSGTLYTLGINSRGQCGTGKMTNNVWTPERVQGLTLAEKKGGNKNATEQDLPVSQVALGFQHGFALTKGGQVYSWGKAGRGQLGREMESDQDPFAQPIPMDSKIIVTQIVSGMHHGALLTADNQVFVWGKNMGRDDKSDKPTDARIPEPVVGLPRLQVLQISAGSHHTSILMKDGSVYAVGIASDEAVPLLDPVQLVPPGQLELPLRQFEAHHDRTTIVDNEGQAFQVHLWKDEGLRAYSMFTPSFVDSLLDDGQSIQSIHRGWRHTIIVTKPK